MTTKITRIDIGYETNFLTLNEDSQEPRNLMANQKDTIEFVKKYGDNIIQISTDDVDQVYLKRVNRIAKHCGYANYTSVKEMFQEMDGVRQEWTEISGQFVKESDN